ncbi:hypothetical protein ACHAW5_001182 [Stephanodiscus triporus]|uniref:Hexosyltransferase n=1 Tax=Stephanodiscus triporus TaxID=2934178 RepID=A0ABD3QD86_9STRA
MAFGLSGNHPGFLSEFEVALKSVLIHAPLERDMHVHIIADREAYQSLAEIFNRTNLSTWITRNSIEIHAYDITPRLPELEKLILDTFIMGGFDPSINIGDLTNVHTMGAFFRLFAHRIISTTVKHIVYMDTDVVIMANLDAIWQQIETNTNSLFHWGLGHCSGFVIFNVQRMSEIWRLAGASPMENISATFNQDANDQLVLLSVNLTYPNEVAIFEDGWDMTVTEKWLYNDDLVERFPDVGMLHLNGAANDDAYWKNHSFISWFPDSWGNGNYSAILPWPWARYQAKAMIHPGSKGHMMNITFWGTSLH